MSTNKISNDINLEIIPSVVFIVPYRNRHQHKIFFTTYLTSILPENLKYEIYFSHQCDVRSFNRGATKNIGFIAIKNKYPEDYRNITFVFNDIDTIPFTYLFDYQTNPGIVKHFYGFTYALGGIVSITGEDLEKTNGYPNFWGWGMEDNVLQKRCEKYNILIDRSHFYKIGNQNIIHLFDGVSRIINQKDPYRATHDNGIDGISTIHGLKYTIDHESNNSIDNLHLNVNINSENIFFINIKSFLTGVRFENDNYHNYDLREPPRQILHPSRIKTKVVNHITNDWSNIPYYPTANDKKQMVRKYGYEKTEEIIQNNLNLSNKLLNVDEQNKKNKQNKYVEQVEQVEQNEKDEQHEKNNYLEQKQNEDINKNVKQNNFDIVLQSVKNKYNLLQIKKINEQHRLNKSNKRIIPPGMNKYSPEYSQYIAPSRQVGISANVRLGGLY
jgi:hypothetical protein